VSALPSGAGKAEQAASRRLNSRTMLSITCYGGVNEIGGHKIVLRDGDRCLSFDFGTSFKRRYRFFEEYLKPRPGAGLLDMLHMELIPPLEGIYRRDLVPTPEFWERWRGHGLYRRMALDGVLLSHAHLDYSGYISFLEPEVPIYCAAMTAIVSKAMLDRRFAGEPDSGDEGLHSSGHASGPDLLEIVRVVNPRVLITVHTESPDCFVDSLHGEAIDVRVPKVGEEILLP